MVEPQSFVYHTVDGVDVALDCYLPASATSSNKAPILIWFHGGGLLQGTRKAIWPHLTSAPEEHGLCVISADYRLAPQVRMPDIMKDVVALMTYVRSDAFFESVQGRVDRSKIIVSGGSAGGWLALLIGLGVGFQACGLTAPERPLAVAAIYPITDLRDPFWTTKQQPVTYFKRVIEPSEVEPFINSNQPVVSSSGATSPRAIFYHYMVQEALLQDLLLHDTGISPEVFAIAQAVPATDDIPPVYIVHGRIDDKVPIRQSEDVVKALQARGLPVTFSPREGLDHLFDMVPEADMRDMYAFIEGILAASE